MNKGLRFDPFPQHLAGTGNNSVNIRILLYYRQKNSTTTQTYAKNRKKTRNAAMRRKPGFQRFNQVFM